MIVFLIFLSFVFSSAYFLKFLNPKFAEYYIGWKRSFECALIFGVFIILIASNPNCIVANIFKFPWFVKLGQSSMGIYIIHFFLLPVFNCSTSLKKLVVIFMFSGSLALISYEWLEKPFISFVKKVLKIIEGEKKNG